MVLSCKKKSFSFCRFEINMKFQFKKGLLLMDRRNFAKTAVAATVTAFSAKNIMAADVSDIAKSTEAYKCKFYPNFGHLKASTKGMSLVDKLKFFYDCGFRGLEDNGMQKRPIEEQNAIAKTMEKLGMEMGVFCSWTEWKSAAFSGNRLDMSKRSTDKAAVRERIKKEAESAIETAKRVNAKWCTVVPGLEDPRLEPEYQFANVVDNLKYYAEFLEKAGLIMVLEPLNIKNHPGLYLKRIPQAYAICKAVNSPSCKILDDLYHQQVTEGNLIENIDTAWSEIAYIQVGDVPGRKEPTTGEINYKNVFKHLWDKGYKGVIGMEHGQSDTTKAGDAKLLAAYRSVDVD